MHVSGYPGSHVVIRRQEEREGIPDDVIIDAAALCTHFSKGPPRSPVSLTRCRHVTKPPGAKPGLVMLRGPVETVKVDLRQEEARLERLFATRFPPMGQSQTLERP